MRLYASYVLPVRTRRWLALLALVVVYLLKPPPIPDLNVEDGTWHFSNSMQQVELQDQQVKFALSH